MNARKVLGVAALLGNKEAKLALQVLDALKAVKRLPPSNAAAAVLQDLVASPIPTFNYHTELVRHDGLSLLLVVSKDPEARNSTPRSTVAPDGGFAFGV